MPVNDQEYQAYVNTQINNIHKELKTVRNNTSTRAEKQLAYKTACELFNQIDSARTNTNNNVFVGIWMELTALQHDFQNTSAPQESNENAPVSVHTPPPSAQTSHGTEINNETENSYTAIHFSMEDSQHKKTEIHFFMQNPQSETITEIQYNQDGNATNFNYQTQSNLPGQQKTISFFYYNSTNETFEQSTRDDQNNLRTRFQYQSNHEH